MKQSNSYRIPLPAENEFATRRFLLFCGVVVALTGAPGCDGINDGPPPPVTLPATEVRIDDAQETTDTETIDVSSHDPPTPIDIELPISMEALEELDQRLVRIRNTMVVIDTYNLAKSGQVTLAADDRLYTPTNSIDPNDTDPQGTQTRGTGNVDQIRASSDRARTLSIMMDDGSSETDPRPVPFLPVKDGVVQSLRIGSRIHDLKGVIHKSDGRHYLVPDHEVSIVPAGRPARPDLADANFVVAGCNVLNFFTTIDDGRNRARGADSTAEFRRQQEKLVAGLLALDADVYGLVELENCVESERALVAALNEQVGEERFLGVGVPQDFQSAPGSDNAIRVGIIYRRDRVLPIGDVGMVANEAFANARTPLLQRFRRIKGGEQVTIIVNHFKSKGRRDASGADLDQHDGQSGYNDSRRNQAAAIASFVRTQNAFDPEGNWLVVGDLNAYRQEDPIDTLRNGGLVDLIDRHAGSDEPYSYVYYGQSGLLDHAFGNQRLANKTTAATVWHVNCDEPRCFDYNLEFNPPELYRPNLFRYSDHDPILVGVKLD